MNPIPRLRPFPASSVQCDGCGGHGCETCDNQGWLSPQDHPAGRRCQLAACAKPLTPDHVAVYCSPECASDDANILAPVQRGYCPDCRHRGFLLGPRGGAAINIECGNLECRSRFNVTPMGWGVMVFVERIPRATEA